jgi:ABC-type polysaccharide/polyol phosphate export permease
MPSPIIYRNSQQKLLLIWALALKNIRVKYKNSLLGFFWSILNPLIFLLIFNYIFGKAFPQIQNYPLYAVTGIVVWTLFPVATNAVISSILENAGILKSIAIAPTVFPKASLVSSAINFYLLLIPFTGIMLWLGLQPGWEVLLALVILHIYLVFILGLGYLLCALNVFYRDIGLLWNTLMPALFYFTPIAYPVDLIPENIRWAMQLNPIYFFVDGVRKCLYEHQVPDLNSWLIMLGIAGGSLLVGYLVFKKLQKNFISFY